MSKGRKTAQTLDTPRRRKLQKAIGKERLAELEEAIAGAAPSREVILETPARARLRKEIGKAELERIEARILGGDL